jgi:hypothetical protein
MICRHCGADHGDSARFCPSTGRPVAPPAPDDEPEPEPTRSSRS